jgi:hypothetical protein
VSFLCSSLTTDRLLESLDASTCLNDLPVLYATPVPTRPAFPGHNLPELILWNTAKLKASFYGLRIRRPISHLGTAPPNEFLVQLRPEWHNLQVASRRSVRRITVFGKLVPQFVPKNSNFFFTALYNVFEYLNRPMGLHSLFPVTAFSDKESDRKR